MLLGLLAAEFGHCDLFVYINSTNLVTKKDVPISSLNWLEGQMGPVFPSDNQVSINVKNLCLKNYNSIDLCRIETRNTET